MPDSEPIRWTLHESGGRDILYDRLKERQKLDVVLGAARRGSGQTIVLRGPPGIGKSALLDYVAQRADGCRLLRTTGVEVESDFAYASLHMLVTPVLSHMPSLPPPQRWALGTALGLEDGPAPDQFLVGLAVLGLLNEAATQQPLICLLDDMQWWDAASARVLTFVARRILAEPIALIFAVRDKEHGELLGGLTTLDVQGLPDKDARSLLDSALTSPLDVKIRNQIVAETNGHPLALLELPRGLSAVQLAGGFGLPGAWSLTSTLEATYTRRLEALPPESRLLLLVAAAENSDDSQLLWRAVDRLGIAADAAGPAADAGLIARNGHVRFCHPLIRSVVYKTAPPDDRVIVHAALASSYDAVHDRDRRAWHRAKATSGLDEAVAADLERSAGAALERGGLGAAAAFLEHAARLSPDPAARAERGMRAAKAKCDAGALDEALDLLRAVDAGPFNATRAAQSQRLRGQIAFQQLKLDRALDLLSSAARAFLPLDPALAREAYLEALTMAMWESHRTDDQVLQELAREALEIPLLRGATLERPVDRAVDQLLRALALRVREHHEQAATTTAGALETVMALTLESPHDSRFLLAAGNLPALAAQDIWDDDTAFDLAGRLVKHTRSRGALIHLQFALPFLTHMHLMAGELEAAKALIDEQEAVAETLTRPSHNYTQLFRLARESTSIADVDTIAAALTTAESSDTTRDVAYFEFALSVLYNALGRPADALPVALRLHQRKRYGFGPMIIPEIVEAAHRVGDAGSISVGLAALKLVTAERPTAWALGVQQWAEAVTASAGDAAGHFHDAIAHLSQTRMNAELARARLLFAEWLQLHGRRRDAQSQFHQARRAFAAMGIKGRLQHIDALLSPGSSFEVATGGQSSVRLTEQEARIARLARDDLTNSEIGERLYISPRTVQYHLHKVFTKLGIRSRTQLAGVELA